MSPTKNSSAASHKAKEEKKEPLKKPAASKKKTKNAQQISERREETPNSAEIKAESRRDGFLGRLRLAWRDTVGAYATDEGETENLLQRLVSFGTLSTEEARRILLLSKEKIEANRKELDERIDESIRRTTARFSIPSQNDLARMTQRLNQAAQRLDALEKRRFRRK